MARRVVVAVLALIASVVGHLMLWTGGWELLREYQQYNGPAANVAAIVAVVIGMAFIAFAALTVAFSSAGVILLGAIHILFGLLVVLIPFDPLGGGFSPAVQFAIQAAEVSRAWSDGLIFSFTLGTGILTGVVFLVSGLVARNRRMTGNLLAALVGLVAGVLGLIGILVAVTGGSTIYRSVFVSFRGQVEVVGVLMLLGGAVLLGLAVLSARWSSAGVIALGVIVFVIGVGWRFIPYGALGPVQSISRDLVNALVYLAPSGLLAVVGVVLVSAGFAVRWRARRAVGGAVEASPEDAPAASV